LNSNSHHTSYLGLIASHTCTALAHTHKSHLHTHTLAKSWFAPVIISEHYSLFLVLTLDCLTILRVISAWPDLGLSLDCDYCCLPWTLPVIWIIPSLCLHCSVCLVLTLPVWLCLIKLQMDSSVFRESLQLHNFQF